MQCTNTPAIDFDQRDIHHGERQISRHVSPRRTSCRITKKTLGNVPFSRRSKEIASAYERGHQLSPKFLSLCVRLNRQSLQLAEKRVGLSTPQPRGSNSLLFFFLFPPRSRYQRVPALSLVVALRFRQRRRKWRSTKRRGKRSTLHQRCLIRKWESLRNRIDDDDDEDEEEEEENEGKQETRRTKWKRG